MERSLAGEDETVLVIRQGRNVVEMIAFPQQDPRGELVAALLPYQGRLELVNVDSAGIGWYLAQHLAEFFPVQPVNVGTAPADSERYINLKAEVYWGLRMRFEAGDVAGIKDEKTITQLSSLRYQHNARGQVVIESKEEARKRGVKSPDRAEAVMLAFAQLLDGNNNVGRILRTNDAGKHWTEVLSTTACHATIQVKGLSRDAECVLKAIHFPTPSIGYGYL